MLQVDEAVRDEVKRRDGSRCGRRRWKFFRARMCLRRLYVDSQQASHRGPGTDQSYWGPMSALFMLLHFMPKLARIEVIFTNGPQLDTAIYC